MQTSFKTTLTLNLYLEGRTKDKVLIICSVYTTMASEQETVGVITGQLVEVHHCSGRIPLLRGDT